MLRTKLLNLLLAAAVLFTVAACSKDDDASGISFGKPASGTAVLGEAASRLEVPEMLPGNAFISHWTEERGEKVMTYCLEYDYSKFHSRWVAFRFDAITREKNVGRKEYSIKPQYPADPNLSEKYAIEDDASFNGYQHGHLCASADRLYSREANDNTFYMTNMSPQVGRFNSPYWSKLENHVQDKGRDKAFSDTLYVCKGGTIATGQVLGFVSRGRMPVPKYYFMALLKVKNGAYSSIGFLMEHKNYGITPTKEILAGHALSVNELEEFTGINFFHNLPDIVEETAENVCLPSVWGL